MADKLEVLKVLATKVDTLVVGGGMAYTFLAARGQHVGSSLLDETHLDGLPGAAGLGRATSCCRPTPAPWSPAAPSGRPRLGHGPRGSVKVIEGDLPDGWTGLDIGPDSAAAFAEVVAGAGTVLWNGPLGAFEDPRFADGTRIVAEAVAHCPGFSVVGRRRQRQRAGGAGPVRPDRLPLHRWRRLAVLHRARGPPAGDRRPAPGPQRARGGEHA